MTKISKGLFILLTLAVLAVVFQYATMTGNEGHLARKPEDLTSFWFYLMMFYTHVFFGGLALLSGTIQTVFTLRKWKVHRVIGKFYVLGVLLSGTSGLYIAVYASAGLIAQSGFFTLGLLWLYTTVMAFVHIKSGRKEQHRQWIIRSMALTFAAITLRLWLPSFMIAGMEFNSAYPIIAWLCWLPNIVVAEFYLIYSKIKTRKLQVAN